MRGLSLDSEFLCDLPSPPPLSVRSLLPDPTSCGCEDHQALPALPALRACVNALKKTSGELKAPPLLPSPHPTASLCLLLPGSALPGHCPTGTLGPPQLAREVRIGVWLLRNPISPPDLSLWEECCLPGPGEGVSMASQ